MDRASKGLFQYRQRQHHQLLFIDSHHAADMERNENIGNAVAIDPRQAHPSPMCNLYRLKGEPAKLARALRATMQPGLNFAAEVYPGYEGLVVAGGQARVMTWGFPLVMKGKDGKALKPKPVNNARTDKLGSPFWRSSFAERRCLIPLTAWAEAEGPKGGKTRTWITTGDEVFAAAGIWRGSNEWGDCYSMVMTDSAEPIRYLHDRMPVLLHADDWGQWQEGELDEALALCRPWDGLLDVEATDLPWVGKRS